MSNPTVTEQMHELVSQCYARGDTPQRIRMGPMTYNQFLAESFFVAVFGGHNGTPIEIWYSLPQGVIHVDGKADNVALSDHEMRLREFMAGKPTEEEVAALKITRVRLGGDNDKADD